MEQEPPPAEATFQLNVPPELEGGSYANLLSVWHTAHEFTLDFSATQPAQPVNPDDPASGVLIPCRVVARIRIAPTLVFDVIRALNENMTRYEDKYGSINPPEPREEEQ
jgi:hypothetical protein